MGIGPLALANYNCADSEAGNLTVKNVASRAGDVLVSFVQAGKQVELYGHSQEVGQEGGIYAQELIQFLTDAGGIDASIRLSISKSPRHCGRAGCSGSDPNIIAKLELGGNSTLYSCSENLH